MNFFVASRLQTCPSFCLLCDNGVGLENTHLLPAVKPCQQRAPEEHWRREGLLRGFVRSPKQTPRVHVPPQGKQGFRGCAAECHRWYFP